MKGLCVKITHFKRPIAAWEGVPLGESDREILSGMNFNISHQLGENVLKMYYIPWSNGKNDSCHYI